MADLWSAWTPLPTLWSPKPSLDSTKQEVAKKNMKLKFKKQAYQTNAVDAVAEWLARELVQRTVALMCVL